MILLDYHNIILHDTLSARFESEKPEALDMTIVDFDGVLYHLSTPTSKTNIQISFRWRCFPELANYGANDILQREYGNMLVTPPQQGFDVTLNVDLTSLPQDAEAREELIRKVSLIKRNILAAPFERAFKEQEQFEDEKQPNPNPELMAVHYREDEAIHIKASQDRVTVIFSTRFKDETDRVFGKVFLQEFVDARKRQDLQNAPPVLFSTREPPLELRHLNLQDSEELSYITFVLFPRHFSALDVREETISRIQIFRDYLHYHIKCAKAYMHTRMRARVRDFLKVLNRAKPENINAEKKTAT
ncbi:actin-related protein 2/3 complex subunit 2 [Umbelopsis sp. PMI_123]|nr:actin-related protein 2/3 complex subunit 2 [Umbelopsis sp. PMI_123]